MHNPHIALVTGASRGIGAETVRLLAAAGFDVVINYRSKAPRAHDVAAEIHAIGRKAWTVQADLTDAEAVQRMAHTVTQECKRLDVLILNASGGMEKDKNQHLKRQQSLNANIASKNANIRNRERFILTLKAQQEKKTKDIQKQEEAVAAVEAKVEAIKKMQQTK